MSAGQLAPHLALLRRVLGLEIQQQYQNRAASGGLHAFFRARFDQLDFDEASATSAESILAYLRRYETARTVEERQQIVATMLRRLDATEARMQAEASAQAAHEPAQATTRSPAGEAKQ